MLLTETILQKEDKMTPKVSVCIPVYGVEKYIERCARSLFEQTMKEGIEFIFVNDCTLDRSIDILKQVLSEYPERKDQVTILHHEKNQGLVGARNTALKVAKGEYIIHCDSDDWVDLDMYEKMYNKAKETNADMVYCDIVMQWESGRKKEIKINEYKSIHKIFKETFHTHKFNSLWNKLVRREIVFNKDYIIPNNIIMGEDLLRVSQMLLKCEIISCCNNIFYHYRRCPESLTASYTNNQVENLLELLCVLSDMLPVNLRHVLDRTKRHILIISLAIANEETEYLWKNHVWIRAKINAFFDCNFHLGARLAIYAGCLNYSFGCWLYKQLKQYQQCIFKLKAIKQ